MKTSKVFVYGTLRNGASNPADGYGAKHVGPAKLAGARMYALGWFPGIKLTPDDPTVPEVVGDVYEVDESIIKHLDRYEGCASDNGPSGLYSRKVVNVEGHGDVFTYEYNGYPDNREPVPNGDWLAFKEA